VRVQYKLFAITLFASFVLVASMLALAQWSFDRGLLEHVNKRALQQYTRLSEQLKSHYQQYGNWKALNGSRYTWLQLQVDAGIEVESKELQRAQEDSSQRSSDHKPRHRPERNNHRFDGPDNERFDSHGPRDHRPPRGDRPPPREHRPPPREHKPPLGEDRPPPPRKKYRQDALALLDADKKLLVGDQVKPEHRQTIELIQEGSLIGYVVYANRERLLDDYDLDLSSQLSSNLWWIAGLMILLSASLALPFSRLLLSPLRPIVASIHSLAKGDFTQRIAVANQDEIGRVAEDVNHLAQQLEEVDTSRKTWLANISHELRTPLAVMRGELEAMLDGIREINKDNLGSAHQEALHLQRLVEDLYQLTSSELGDDNVAQMSYQKQALDFSALVEDDLERFQPLIAKAGLDFRFMNTAESENEETWIKGDASRLSQLIHNLVNNSIKYTQAPGSLVAELMVKNDVIIFTLMDSAPSVKEGELEKIFDHLYRAEQSRNRKTGGAGLGLAICKKIAESHGGELTASLSELGGIKMTLCLPRS